MSLEIRLKCGSGLLSGSKIGAFGNNNSFSNKLIVQEEVWFRRIVKELCVELRIFVRQMYFLR
jgi:hypothetical protein